MVFDATKTIDLEEGWAYMEVLTQRWLVKKNDILCHSGPRTQILTSFSYAEWY